MGFALLDIFNAANKIISLQLEVDWGTVLHGNGDLALAVLLTQIGPPRGGGCCWPCWGDAHVAPGQGPSCDMDRGFYKGD